MEVKLEGLIEKIKKEGIAAAQLRAEEIEQTARAQAQKIIEEAQQEAARFVADAQHQADKIKANATAALTQAARDLSLTVKEELVNIFDRILKAGVDEALDAEFLKTLLLKVVDNWSPAKDVVLEVYVSEADKRKLTDSVFAEFKKKAKNNIEIKANRSIDQGFRIGVKGQALYYDFTDESILAVLKKFLNPALAAVLHTR